MSTVAPYDTLQLTATAFNVDGVPLTGAPQPTIITTDSALRVTANGLLTAREARTGVLVIASMVYQGIRLADTAIVNITDTVVSPLPQRLHLGLQSGDSAKIAMPRYLSALYFPTSKTIDVEVLDGTDTPIPSAFVSLSTSDVLQGTVDPTTNTGTATVQIDNLTSHAGTITVYGMATIYGVTMRDSLQLTLTPPLWGEFTLSQAATSPTQPPVNTIVPSTITIGIGGAVWWANRLPDSLDIVFDDPTGVQADTLFLNSGAGNILPWPGQPVRLSWDYVRIRTFSRAGTFHFHSLRTGITGTVIVK
jgi:hypothetical protein